MGRKIEERDFVFPVDSGPKVCNGFCFEKCCVSCVVESSNEIHPEVLDAPNTIMFVLNMIIKCTCSRSINNSAFVLSMPNRKFSNSPTDITLLALITCVSIDYVLVLTGISGE